MRRRNMKAGPLAWFLGIIVTLIAAPIVIVLALRWLPAPTTSFMLQSPTRPVQHQWVSHEKIAEVARKAVVAAEDQKFWDHDGFDIEAMKKAYEGNKQGRRQRGGSTISQQTAKNLFLWSGGGYIRKGIEAWFTLLIETLWSKPRILDVYLNIAEFGPGVYGVEAAAQKFFGKPAALLSASEAARLAAVLPSPRRWKVQAPGPYVQSRAAWILRQLGYAGGPRIEDQEPIAPPGEWPLEEPFEATGPAAPADPPAALQPDDEPFSPPPPEAAPLQPEPAEAPVPVPAEPAAEPVAPPAPAPG